MTELLKGHVSPETAYVVPNYPYGFRLRCRMRYWLEYKPAGVRLVTQSSNPKRPGLVWNKPKAGVYHRFGAALYLDDKGHVQAAGLSEYCDAAEAKAFLDTYGEGVPEPAQEMLRRFVAAKAAYEANRNKGDPLNVGLPEARKAFVAPLPGSSPDCDPGTGDQKD